VRIEPWGTDDLPLLERLLGDPLMMEHLGGPESPEQIAARQGRYERMRADQGRMFKIVEATTAEGAGWVGYWEREWRGEEVYEIGWAVLPDFQGKGLASLATAEALVIARSDGRHRFAHAFPSVDNAASNAICRKLGFTLVEECEFEYPRGSFMRCHDWRLDLQGAGPTGGPV
jgi:RimJ/RimL family protein N-acetyltransferase